MKKIFVITALVAVSAATIGLILHHSLPLEEQLRIAGSRVVCAGSLGNTAEYYNAAIRYNRLARQIGKEEYAVSIAYTTPPAYVAESVKWSHGCRFHS